jgi:hypothetical protein
VVIPVVDIVGAVVHLNFWARGPAQAADSHPPAEEVLMAATNPHQELADPAFGRIGCHLE